MESKGRKILDLKRLIRSFKYALSGIKSSLKDEQNIKIHLTASVIVILLNIFLKVTYYEWIITILLVGLVLMAELFNTAVEYTVDLATSKIEENAKFAKDIAAGAVLIIAFFSLIIGCIIYIPKIISLF